MKQEKEMKSETDESADRHCYIPGWVMDLDLSWAKKALVGRIQALEQQRGYCYASNSYLADDMGTSERTIRRHISELEGEDVLCIEYSEESHQRRVNTVKRPGLKRPGGTDTSGGEDTSVRGGRTDTSPPSKCREEYRGEDRDTQKRVCAREKTGKNQNSELSAEIEALIEHWNQHEHLASQQPDVSPERAAVIIDKLEGSWDTEDIISAIDNLNDILSRENRPIGISSSWNLIDFLAHKEGDTAWKVADDPESFHEEDDTSDTTDSPTGPEKMGPLDETDREQQLREKRVDQAFRRNLIVSLSEESEKRQSEVLELARDYALGNLASRLTGDILPLTVEQIDDMSSEKSFLISAYNEYLTDDETDELRKQARDQTQNKPKSA